VFHREMHAAASRFHSRKRFASFLGVSEAMANMMIRRDRDVSLFHALTIDTWSQGDFPAERLVSNPQYARLIRKMKYMSQQQCHNTSQPLVHLPPLALDPQYWSFCRPDYPPLAEATQPLIADNESRLLCGLPCFLAKKMHVSQRLCTLLVDLPALLQGAASLDTVPYALWISERVAIGMALEHTLATLRIPSSSRPNSDASGGRMDARIAALCGIGGKMRYRDAKAVFTQGIAALIHAMDKKHLSVYRAAQLARTAHAQQRASLAHLLSSRSATITFE